MVFLRQSPRKRGQFAAAYFLTLLAPCVLAQAPSVTLSEPPAPLLPQRFGAWQLEAAPTTGTEASDLDAAHTSELKEDGLKRFAVARYTHGTATLDVQAVQFVDATGAAAGFTLYRSASKDLRSLPASAKLGSESVGKSDEAVFRTGNILVLAKAERVNPIELQTLATTLPKIGGPKGMSPLLPTLLPQKGLDADSVRYTLGPASYAATGGFLPAEMLGFEKAAEEVTANYTARSAKGTLTLLLYPTPQIAGDRGRAIEGWVNLHKDGLGTVKMRREGPLVLMTTGGFAPDDAQRIIENIHLHSEVTWNKPVPLEFHTEVRKTASLLVSIAVLSGVLMTAAVLLGLFLGVGRASLRVLMGKSAAIEPEFLGLGLQRGPAAPIRSFDKTAPE